MYMIEYFLSVHARTCILIEENRITRLKPPLV